MAEMKQAQPVTWHEGDILVVRIPMRSERHGSRKKIVSASSTRDWAMTELILVW